MANTKQDFYGWVKQVYPGYWPGDMSTVDWTDAYHKPMLDIWIALGYPTEGVSAAGEGAPMEATTSTTVASLPRGVTLTGERKFIGKDEYGKGSDGRWYQIAPTPSVGGATSFPTEPPPSGYAWKYDEMLGMWYPNYVGFGAGTAPEVPEIGMPWDNPKPGETWMEYVPGQVMAEYNTGRYYNIKTGGEISAYDAGQIATAYAVSMKATTAPEAPPETLPGASTPIPGGVKEGETVTLPDGSTGYWTRDNQGYPLWRALTSGVDQAEIDRRKAEAEATRLWREQQLEEERAAREAQGAWQQQQLGWWQQEAKIRADEERRQMTAQLAANPRSWLEYASYTGTTPTVQPWMLPLMPQQYGLKTGEPIPGYSPQGMGGMPALTPASTQLWARMGPTAQQQLLGYGTARTGQTPEEQTWRLWSQAPPSGAFGGLSWQR